jgi:hypothetical protein
MRKPERVLEQLLSSYKYLIHDNSPARKTNHNSVTSLQSQPPSFTQPWYSPLLAIGEYDFYTTYIWRIILIMMGFPGSAGQFRRRGHATS